MIKTTLYIEGMSCNMCEAHINSLIRKNFPVKKVTSSHRKGKTEIISQYPLDETSLRENLAAMGYSLITTCQETYQKKWLGLFEHK